MKQCRPRSLSAGYYVTNDFRDETMATPKLRIEPTIGPAAASQRVRAPRRTAPAPAARPAIVSLLAYMYLASGLICAALLISGHSDRDPLEFAVSWPYPTLLLCGIAVTAGCFLLIGMQVAWYLAAIVLIDSMAVALWEAQRVFHETVGALGSAASVVSNYAGSGLRFALSCGLLIYLFSPELRKFLKIETSHAWLGLMLLVALEAALIIVIGLPSA